MNCVVFTWGFRWNFRPTYKMAQNPVLPRASSLRRSYGLLENGGPLRGCHTILPCRPCILQEGPWEAATPSAMSFSSHTHTHIGISEWLADEWQCGWMAVWMNGSVDEWQCGWSSFCVSVNISGFLYCTWRGVHSYQIPSQNTKKWFSKENVLMHSVFKHLKEILSQFCG